MARRGATPRLAARVGRAGRRRIILVGEWLDSVAPTKELEVVPTMGIRNRDYMKRPSDGDDERASEPDARLEGFFSAFLEKHPKFFRYSGIALVAIFILTIVLAKALSGAH